jgi:integrase
MAKEVQGYVYPENKHDKDARWFARYTFTDSSGKRKNVKRLEATEQAARKKLAKIIKEFEQVGEQTVAGDRMTFAKISDIYSKRKLIEAQYRGGKKTRGLRSIKPVEVALRALKEHFANKRVKLIKHSDIEKYKHVRLDTPKANGEERAIATVNRELELLRAMMRFAQREGYILISPFERGDSLISKADETKRERVLMHDEERRLLNACTGRRAHLRPLLIAALDTAARRGELFKLKWSDVDFTKRLIRLRATTTKTATARTIFITTRLYEELDKLWQESPQNSEMLVFGITDTVKTAFASACREAGIEGFRFHDCRHTAITRMIAAGMPSAEVMKRSGHTQHSTFARYVNPSDDQVSKSASLLDSFNAKAGVQEAQSEMVN